MGTRCRDGKRAAGAAAGCGLGVAALVHAAWASGVTWPAASADELADLVVGSRPFPRPAATWAVSGALAAAAVVVAAGATDRGGKVGWVRLASRAVAAALLLRGAGGLVVSGAGLGTATASFRRGDLRVYSPLCLALGSLVAVSVRSPHDASRRSARTSADTSVR